MTNEKNKKDVFLEAIKGTAPIKKSNKNYKPFLQTKINKNRPEKNLDVSFQYSSNNPFINISVNEGNDRIIIHQCPSGYPARLPSINLRIIDTLRQLYHYPIFLI